MALAMACPHCKVNKVETVRSAWFIQGFLLFARYGSKSYVGCEGCTRGKVISSFVLTLIMGWWCFPWGIGTPFVLLQNLIEMASGPNKGALRTLLAKQGLEYEDLEVDANGRTRGESMLIDGILATMHGMIWSDGSADPREIEAATAIVTSMLGERVDAAHIGRTLASKQPPPARELASLKIDTRLVLMRAACAVADADGVVAEGELAELRAIGARLQLSDEIVGRFVAALQRPGPEVDELRKIAASVLGIEASAEAPEVQTAYQRLRVEAAEQEDAAAQQARLQELDFAYETMLGAPPVAA